MSYGSPLCPCAISALFTKPTHVLTALQRTNLQWAMQPVTSAAGAAASAPAEAGRRVHTLPVHSCVLDPMDRRRLAFVLGDSLTGGELLCTAADNSMQMLVLNLKLQTNHDPDNDTAHPTDHGATF